MPPTESPTAPAATESTTATIDAPASTDKNPAEFMADVMGDFADMDAGKPPPAKAEKPKPSAQGKKQSAKPIEKTKQERVEEPEKKTEESEKPSSEKSEETKPEGGKSYMRTLGEKYDNLKKEVEQTYKPELQKLRAKIQEYETKKPEDAAPLLERVKQLESRNQQLEKHIEYVDYTKSKDFESNYEKPYAQAWTEAVAEFQELKVREPAGEDESGEPVFKSRPATKDDLIRLGSMTLSDMDEAAQRMFGPSASRAINHIQNLRKLLLSRNNALENARQRAGEFKSRQEAEMHSRTETLAKAWQETDKELREQYPRAFVAEDGNEADKAAHTKGFALADLLFIGSDGLTPEQVEALPEHFRNIVKSKKPLTEQDRVKLHAIARVKMANHDRQLARVRAYQERISELEASLAEYEKSEPDASKAGGKGDKSVSKDWLETAEDELRALDK